MQTQQPAAPQTKLSLWGIIKNLFNKIARSYFVFMLHLSPYQNITVTVLAYSALGFILLSLPGMSTTHVAWTDTLFTAASAATTTGLTTVNFASSYTLAGKIVVLILIQICAMGYMTFASYIHLSFSHRVAHRQQEILNAAFALPQNLKLKDFLHAVIIFTFIVETIGATLLYYHFHTLGMGTAKALWYGVFHSISAFCTAGFSLFEGSFTGFEQDNFLRTVISFLSLSGAMGFIIVVDVYNRLARRTAALSYTTKTILFTTGIMLFLGTILIFVSEPEVSLFNSFFSAMSAMTTAGFVTVPMMALSTGSLLIIMLFMCIGASPAGTGGGIKTTTITAAWAIVYSRLKGRAQVTFFGREIPLQRLYMAAAAFILFVMVLFASVFLLEFTQNGAFLDMLFVSGAALSTAGMGSPIAETLNTAGKIIIIATMIVGRVGVITFGMAVLSEEDNKPQTFSPLKEDLAL